MPDIRAQLAQVLRKEGKADEARALIDQSVPPLPMPASPGGRSRFVDLSGPFSDMDRAREYVAEGDQQQAEVAYLQAISAFENMRTATPIAQADLSGALGQNSTAKSIATPKLKAFCCAVFKSGNVCPELQRGIGPSLQIA